jgi:hypothetical protein
MKTSPFLCQRAPCMYVVRRISEIYCVYLLLKKTYEVILSWLLEVPLEGRIKTIYSTRLIDERDLHVHASWGETLVTGTYACVAGKISINNVSCVAATYGILNRDAGDLWYLAPMMSQAVSSSQAQIAYGGVRKRGRSKAIDFSLPIIMPPTRPRTGWQWRNPIMRISKNY